MNYSCHLMFYNTLFNTSRTISTCFIEQFKIVVTHMVKLSYFPNNKLISAVRPSYRVCEMIKMSAWRRLRREIVHVHRTLCKPLSRCFYTWIKKMKNIIGKIWHFCENHVWVYSCTITVYCVTWPQKLAYEIQLTHSIHSL